VPHGIDASVAIVAGVAVDVVGVGGVDVVIRASDHCTTNVILRLIDG
jgi:hypothetical protein